VHEWQHTTQDTVLLGKDIMGAVAECCCNDVTPCGSMKKSAFRCRNDVVIPRCTLLWMEYPGAITVFGLYYKMHGQAVFVSGRVNWTANASSIRAHAKSRTSRVNRSGMALRFR
jgi:hypothetical protein